MAYSEVGLKGFLLSGEKSPRSLQESACVSLAKFSISAGQAEKTIIWQWGRNKQLLITNHWELSVLLLILPFPPNKMSFYKQ